MNPRLTFIRLGLLAAILLLANAFYFSHGFHRPLTWVCIGLDVIFVVSAAVALASVKRRA